MEKEEKQTKITTPVAIIVAGFLVMVGIILSNSLSGVPKTKTLSQQLGISKEKITACIEGTDIESLYKKVDASVNSAMKGLPEGQRGTPYSIVIGSNGVKTDVNGAQSYETFQKAIEEVKSGTVTKQYTGEVVVDEEGDHVYGRKDSPIKIIEYSDYECPFCKKVHPTIKKIVDDSNGQVSWVFRHWPLHQNSVAKLVAGECVAKIKGNDAFWKYSDLVFNLLDTGESNSFGNQL